MAVSKAQQQAVHRYVKENYDRMELTLKKGLKSEIKDYATARGESVNGFIGRAIAQAMQPPPVCSVPPDKAEEVKAHIEVIGEDEASFIGRAVDEQMRRDKTSLRMGINPATGKKITLEGGAQHE